MNVVKDWYSSKRLICSDVAKHQAYGFGLSSHNRVIGGQGLSITGEFGFRAEVREHQVQ
jgi:hypothetical protein